LLVGRLLVLVLLFVFVLLRILFLVFVFVFLLVLVLLLVFILLFLLVLVFPVLFVFIFVLILVLLLAANLMAGFGPTVPGDRFRWVVIAGAPAENLPQSHDQQTRGQDAAAPHQEPLPPGRRTAKRRQAQPQRLIRLLALGVFPFHDRLGQWRPAERDRFRPLD